MVSENLRTLVSTNAAWFAGVCPETADSLAEVEQQLRVGLPESLKWLLTNYGYSSACGVPNLAGAVELTIRCREAIGLPSRYVVHEDKGDAGVVLLDTATPSGRVIWIGAPEVPRLTTGEAITDMDEFVDFVAWVSQCLQDAKERTDA